MRLLAALSRSLLPTNLPLLPRLLQLPVALRVDLRLTTSEHVLRRDIADGTVQSNIVVMLYGEFSARVRKARKLAIQFGLLLRGLTLRKSLSHLWCLPEGVGRPPGKG